MKRALKLPLGDYEATKALLEGVPAQLSSWCIAHVQRIMSFELVLLFHECIAAQSRLP